MGSLYKDEQGDWITVCLKYLLFVFNFLFWVSLRSTLLLEGIVLPKIKNDWKCTPPQVIHDVDEFVSAL